MKPGAGSARSSTSASPKYRQAVWSTRIRIAARRRRGASDLGVKRNSAECHRYSIGRPAVASQRTMATHERRAP